MFKTLLNECMDGKVLSETEAEQAMDEIMKGNATESQIASFLTIMRFRGETVDEMTGFTRSMREHAIQLPHEESFVIDTCGTGGDNRSTYNISTASAIALSSFGVKVAKHGNRSVSSRSGSADALDALGVAIQTSPEEAIQSLRQQNMTFLFAPMYHVAMKHAVTPRKEIGFRTIFNLLGPLTNPANASAQVIGVFDKEYAKKMAETLKRLGSKRVLLVTGEDGMDEVTITGKTFITELNGGVIREYTITPEDVGLERANLSDVQVKTPEESAALIRAIFTGEVNGAAKDILLLNVAAGLYVSDEVTTFAEGVRTAEKALQSGQFLQQLQRLQKEKVEKQHA